MDQKILQPLVLQPAMQRQLRKPILIITVTDGAPAGEQRLHIVNVISNAVNQLRNTQYGPDALSFQFAQVSHGLQHVVVKDSELIVLRQVGNDMGARDFLQELDANPQIGSLIDCTSNYELEADQARQTSGIDLSPELWLVKLLLGPVDSSESKSSHNASGICNLLTSFVVEQATTARMNGDTKAIFGLVLFKSEGTTGYTFGNSDFILLYLVIRL